MSLVYKNFFRLFIYCRNQITAAKAKGEIENHIIKQHLSAIGNYMQHRPTTPDKKWALIGPLQTSYLQPVVNLDLVSQPWNTGEFLLFASISHQSNQRSIACTSRPLLIGLMRAGGCSALADFRCESSRKMGTVMSGS